MKHINGKPSFRIINKSKDGLKIENPLKPNEPSLMSWKQFEENFEFTDEKKLWCTTRTDTQQARMTKFLSERVRKNPMFMIAVLAKADSPHGLEKAYAFGEVMAEFQEEFPDQTPLSFIQQVRLLKTVMEHQMASVR